MTQKQHDELNSFFVDIFNKILLQEEQAVAKKGFSNLSTKELHILEAVKLGQTCEKNTMTDLAGKVGTTVGALTTAVSALVRKEYLVRERPENDRRIVRVHLTPQGEMAEKHHRIYHEKMIESVAQTLNEESLDNLIDTLQKLQVFFSNK